MNIRANPKTGETSIKLTKREHDALSLAGSICRTIAANSVGQRAKEAQSVSAALIEVEKNCVDQAV